MLEILAAQPVPAGVKEVAGAMLLAIIAASILSAVLMLFVWGMIFKRAGYSFALALLVYVTAVTFAAVLVGKLIQAITTKEPQRGTPED